MKAPKQAGRSETTSFLLSACAIIALVTIILIIMFSANHRQYAAVRTETTASQETAFDQTETTTASP